MYELEWTDETRWAQEAPVDGLARPSQLPPEKVAETAVLHWQEHCLECAPPACYANCALYVRREDGKCRRFHYGLRPHPDFQGLLRYGADVRFRPWGKLESTLYGKKATVKQQRGMDRLDTLAGRTAELLAPIDRRRRINGRLYTGREKYLPKTPLQDAGGFDDFVLECYAPEEPPERLILEYVQDEVIALRHAFPLKRGHNFHTLPARAFGKDGRILVYPEDDAECRLIFTWLDLVSYAHGPAQPAAKVKCVAWDLDNTLWEGVLLEDGEEGIRLRQDASDLIRALDERGILQTVVSKNEHAQAWALLERLGLDEYFLYPAISWGQKSEGLKQIAERLNIGIDTFALIDDSPFERAEVQAALPQVRTFPEGELGSLLQAPEFDVPVTATSRTRRESYRVGMERERAQERFGGDFMVFLRSCGLHARLFVPREEADVVRCMELVQRSNQLNLSKRSYEEDEFRTLLATDGIFTVALDCGDRFGQYGTVGFCAVDERGSAPRVTDFVLSCRVAQKRVEHALFRWLGERERARGATRLEADLVRTDRNAALVRVLDELPFEAISSDGPRSLMSWELATPVADEGVVELVDEAT